jgi:hypothetical protein
MNLRRKVGRPSFVTNSEQTFPRVLTGEYRILRHDESVSPAGSECRERTALFVFRNKHPQKLQNRLFELPVQRWEFCGTRGISAFTAMTIVTPSP